MYNQYKNLITYYLKVSNYDIIQGYLTTECHGVLHRVTRSKNYNSATPG